MATLREREGAYFVDYHVGGRRVRKHVGKSKRIAELVLKDIEVKIAKGELGFNPPKDTDLSKLFEEYKKYSATHHSPHTQERYNAIVDNFKGFLALYPYIGNISHLNNKTFMDYQAYRKKQEAANKTINMEITCLRTILALAVKWNMAKNNPTDGINLLKEEKNTTPVFLSKEQCKKILDNADEFMKSAIFTFLNTGMRKSELENLEWRDIDFERRKIKIQYKDDWSPKTSERQIPINDGLMNLLKKIKKEAKPGCPYVFHKEGDTLDKNFLRKRFMVITEKCGFPEITKIHTLRHTFASHLVMSGVDLPTLRKLMGHSDIETTMIYSHLSDAHIDKAVDNLSF